MSAPVGSVESAPHGTAQKMQRHALAATTSGMVGMAVSIVLDVLVMAVFGLGRTTDAYFVATTVPTLLTTIVALQASKVVQPMFIASRERLGAAAGWRFLNVVMTVGSWVAVVVGAACILLSDLLIRVQAPGFESPDLKLGAQLSYGFFLALPLTWPIAVMRVALNSQGEFSIAGAGRVLDSVFKILFVIVLSKTIGIFALVLGMLVGNMCQLIVSYVWLKRRGYQFEYLPEWRHPDLRTMSGLMLYPLGGQLSSVAVDVVSNNLSSLLGPGKVTALRLATRIIDAMSGLFANSIVTVSMPVVAGAVARGEKQRAMDHLRHGISLLLLVTIPISIWLAMTSRPLIALLYQRMNFTATDVALVSGLLVAMIPYIFLSRLLGLAELPFFGGGNTRIPTLIALAQSILCVALTYLLFGVMDLFAFPVARVASYLLTSVYLLALASSRWGSLNLRGLAGSTARITAASVVMGVFVFLGQQFVTSLPETGTFAMWARFILPSAIGGGAALAALVLFRVVGLRRSGGFPFVSVSLEIS